MADLDDLDYKSITEMSPDEAIEVMRQLRLNRRTPTVSKKTSVKTQRKQVQQTSISNMSAEAAAELLKLLEG